MCDMIIRFGGGDGNGIQNTVLVLCNSKHTWVVKLRLIVSFLFYTKLFSTRLD